MKKESSSSGMCKARYHNGKFLLLLGKIKLQSFEVSHEYFFLLWNKCLPLSTTVLQLEPHFKPSKLTKCQWALKNIRKFISYLKVYNICTMKNITNSIKIVFQFRYTCTVFKLLENLVCYQRRWSTAIMKKIMVTMNWSWRFRSICTFSTVFNVFYWNVAL